MLIESLPPKIRAFIAFRVSAEVEAELAGFIEKLSSPRDGIRWTRRDKLHVTLKFLGAAIDSRTLASLADALRRVANLTTPLFVHTHGVGGFPDLHRPRVLWVGLQSEELAMLAAHVENAAVQSGFEPSDRPWAAHLTIGRIRSPRRIRGALKQLHEARERDFGVSRVGEIGLYRSRPSATGAIYDKLEAFPFSSPGRASVG